jgi:hypothetical protein
MGNDQVIMALEEQVTCYRRLAKLAELQHDHVQHDRTEELIDVLAHRQTVLEQVAQLEQKISPARGQWNDYLGRLPDGQRRHVERLVDESRQLLREITTADQHDALVLQQRKLSLGRQINGATAARQVNRTYAAAAYVNHAARINVKQ